ncbi:MAG: type II CAAX prenyl endopeptidase Rce1 family protein [Pirellulaceae bacterium]
MIVAFLAAGFWGWVHSLRSVARGGWLLPPAPPLDPPWGLADLLLSVVILLVCQGAAEGVVRAKYQIPPDLRFEEMASEPRAMLLLAGALATLAALACSFIWITFRGATRRDLGIEPKHAARDLGLGLLAFAMVAPGVYGLQWILVQWVESKHPLIELLKENPDPRFLILSTFSAVLVAPLAEEYLFRVLLQSWLERLARGDVDTASMLVGRLDTSTPSEESDWRDGDEDDPDSAENNPDFADRDRLRSERGQRRPPFWPIWVSAGLFAGAHWSHGPDPIPLFLFAIALGYLYQRTRRILPCIVLHLLLNTCSLAALWLDVYGGAAN